MIPEGLEATIWYWALAIVPIAAVSRCFLLDADAHRLTAGSLGAIFESELPQWLLSQTDVGPSLWGSRGFASHCGHRS